MKLGDNMTAVDVRSMWEDICPRKTRPPRIGDIPRHSAVDEESPGASSHRLAPSPPDPTEPMLERFGAHGDVIFTPKTSPARKTPKNDLSHTEATCIDPGKGHPPPTIGDGEDSPLASRTFDLLSFRTARSQVGDFPYQDNRKRETNKGVPRILQDPKAITNSFPDLEEPEPTAVTRRRSSSSKECPEGRLIRLSSSPSQEIREVRKDSALYLEEIENLQNLNDTLRSRISRSLAPRRESSGYASSLGTFDEDRRCSEVELPSLRERRRSSTKRLTSETFQPRRVDNESYSLERMPTTEIHRKVSNSGLDMPDIQEIKDLEQDSPLLSFEDLGKVSPISDRKSLVIEKLSSAPPSEFASSGATKTDDDFPTVDNAKRQGETLSYAEVLARSAIAKGPLNKPRTLLRTESFNMETASSDNSQNVNQSPGKARQRKRIVHQYSTPNFSSTELESILEKPSERSPENPKDQPEAHAKKTKEVENTSIEESSKQDKDSKKLLPKSVKVYQLLSTQSEDRGDGVPHLSDRRVSLQISRHEDDSLPVPSVKPEEKKLLHAESVPALSVPGLIDPGSQYLTPSAAGALPVRKLSSPAEVGASQRHLGDVGLVGVRPIYPYCPYSPYGSPQGSPRTKRRPLRESRRVSIDNRQGALQLNQYKLLDNIGQGSFGIVKLAFNEEDETHYAMKILSKKKLMKKAGIFGRMAPGRKGTSNPLAKVYREIALLKKLDHPNVVKLVEVLDDPDEDNLYLVFELVQKGEVLQLPTDKPLDEETARTHFRDIVMGVEYLHYQRIVHRDIKPSNLLVDSEGRVKVADLGVSAELRAAGELLSGPAGTPAFAAPETTTPGAEYSGTLCDVWSMGVTLYSLVTGRVPWDGAGSIVGVQAAVRSEPLKFPDEPVLPENLRELISRMLTKEPSERIVLPEIKEHPWVTRNGTELLPSEADNCRLPVTVTDEEVARVVTRVPKLDTLILIKTMLKQHSFQNPFLAKRSTKSVSGDVPSSENSSKGTSNHSANGSENVNSRTEKFHKAGRSNSAPDSYEWNVNDRQVSVESPLPSVSESLTQEAEAEKR